MILKQPFGQFAQLRAGCHVCRNDVVARVEGADRHESRCNLRWNFIVTDVLGFGCFTYENRTDALVRRRFRLDPDMKAEAPLHPVG